MAYDAKKKERYDGTPKTPAIPPHMRAARLSKGQVDAFKESDRITNAAPAMKKGGRRAREKKAIAAAKTVTKAASRSRRNTAASSPEPAAAKSAEE